MFPSIPLLTPTTVNTVPSYGQKIAFTGKNINKTKHSSRQPITIENYHQVDDILARGAKPTESQITELKIHGFKHIISFCTNYNYKKGIYNGLPKEAKWAEKQGIQFHWLPFHSKDNPTDAHIKEFFSITDNARLNNEKVFIHCRHGADRTGTFAAIYKIRNYKAKLDDVIKEMLKYGHNAKSNPNLIPFVLMYEQQERFNMKGLIIRLYAQIKKSAGKI